MEDATVAYPPAAHHQGIGKLNAERIVEFRAAKRDRDRRACHEREFQLAGGVVHGLGLRPIVGEVLVGEEGNGAARLPVHIHDLLKEFVARIELLLFFVERVFAVFGHYNDAIHGELAGTERQRVGDALYHGKPVCLREPVPDIARVQLVHEQRHHAAGWVIVLVIDPVTLQKAGDHVIGVGADVIRGGDRRNALRRRAPQREGGGAEREKLTSSHAFSPWLFGFLPGGRRCAFPHRGRTGNRSVCRPATGAGTACP